MLLLGGARAQAIVTIILAAPAPDAGVVCVFRAGRIKEGIAQAQGQNPPIATTGQASTPKSQRIS